MNWVFALTRFVHWFYLLLNENGYMYYLLLGMTAILVLNWFQIEATELSHRAGCVFTSHSLPESAINAYQLLASCRKVPAFFVRLSRVLSLVSGQVMLKLRNPRRWV